MRCLPKDPTFILHFVGSAMTAGSSHNPALARWYLLLSTSREPQSSAAPPTPAPAPVAVAVSHRHHHHEPLLLLSKNNTLSL
jgi:hypothetical protein